jgi:hypothetical protein
VQGAGPAVMQSQISSRLTPWAPEPSLGVAAGIQKGNRQQKRKQKGAAETDPVGEEDEYELPPIWRHKRQTRIKRDLRAHQASQHERKNGLNRPMLIRCSLRRSIVPITYPVRFRSLPNTLGATLMTNGRHALSNLVFSPSILREVPLFV